MTELATLTTAEVDYLAQCEETISHGLQTFIEVGTALAMIRDNRLYRATHATFEDYCVQRWGISFRHANRLIEAASVTEMILGPIGPTGVAEVAEVPANESQARPLAKLLPHPMAEPEVKAAAEEEIRETWAEAVQTAPRAADGTPKVTAKHVEETVARRLADEPAPAPAERKQPARKPLPDAFQAAAWDLVKVAERLDRLATDDRFPRNAEQVGRLSRHDLLRAVDLLAVVVDRIPDPNKESTE